MKKLGRKLGVGGGLGGWLACRAGQGERETLKNKSGRGETERRMDCLLSPPSSFPLAFAASAKKGSEARPRRKRKEKLLLLQFLSLRRCTAHRRKDLDELVEEEEEEGGRETSCFVFSIYDPPPSPRGSPPPFRLLGDNKDMDSPGN